MYKIYKIQSLVDSSCYIGSTKQSLCQRKAEHVYTHKNRTKRGGGYTSSHIIEKGAWEMILLEETNDRYTREKYYINNTSGCVNKLMNDSFKFEIDRLTNNLSELNINDTSSTVRQEVVDNPVSETMDEEAQLQADKTSTRDENILSLQIDST